MKLKDIFLKIHHTFTISSLHTFEEEKEEEKRLTKKNIMCSFEKTELLMDE